jgi:hypothetical protein
VVSDTATCNAQIVFKILPCLAYSLCLEKVWAYKMTILSLLFVISSIAARQRLGEHIAAATNARNNRRIVGRVVCYPVLVVSKESGQFSQSCEAVRSSHELC